jgi:2-oxoglutarate dehydrogenase E1 component
MADFPDHAQLANLAFIEDLYRRYLSDPKSVDPSWLHFFEGIDFAGFLNKTPVGISDQKLRIALLINAYRCHGHLLASFNSLEGQKEATPLLSLKTLGFSEDELDQPFPTLGLLDTNEALLRQIIETLTSIYASKIGFEYMDLGSLEMEQWIQAQIEKPSSNQLSEEEKKKLLEHLVRAEGLETFLHTKYVGQKRFSLEGNETLIPLLAALISEAAQLGVETCVLGMAHRGRLNVLANILQKPYAVLFKEFEDTIELLPTEHGDVKYHKGYSSFFEKMELSLAFNSSCLESVDGIVLGQTKAKQVLKKDEALNQVVTFLMHGDAAMTGQGVFYETLEMGRVDGFATGGTIQIAINNQMGFTTSPDQGRSTRYCTDIAKTFGAPVFHVNAEEPENCIWVARLAMQIRQKFHCDVFIDLNGYRKYGHNEGDEPAFTQPLEYTQIRARKTIRAKYVEENHLENLNQTLEEAFKLQLNEALSAAKKGKIFTPKERIGISWDQFKQPEETTFFNPVSTSVNAKTLQQLMTLFCRVPEGFQIHPKLTKVLQLRLAAVQGDPKQPLIDWGCAECLAISSLVEEGIPFRLTGQDSCRGTFSHRHAVWIDQKTGENYTPYAHLKPSQVRCDIYNTILSEFGSLGFELGYSWADSKTLVCWEAQYGDFVIGAEILIDHYIAAAEQKWAAYSSLTLLLPHGYEGGGPEHSSGRMERFLQLAANQNIQVVYPTTPAQYFHLLRRQALRPIKKPLIVFTPKSLLRFPSCVSSLQDLSTSSFEEMLDDLDPPKDAKKIVLCTGKIYYDLVSLKRDFILIRLEQIYPLHTKKLEKIFAKYQSIKEVVWIQEEPENMGAWEFLKEPLAKILPQSSILTSITRPRSGSTATGSPSLHQQELDVLLARLKGSKNES